jgi:hypothetical protein
MNEATTRVVALGSLAEPGDDSSVRDFPKVPAFPRPQHVYHGGHSGNNDPVAIAAKLIAKAVSAQASDMAKADRRVEDARAMLVGYLDTVCRFCLGPAWSGRPQELAEQLLAWLPLLERTTVLMAGPRGARTWNTAKARSATDELEAMAEEILAFLRLHYRALPVVPELKPVVGLFRWVVRSWDTPNWDRYTAFLDATILFVELRLDEGSSPTVLGQMIPGFAAPLAEARELSERRLALFDDRRLRPTALAAKLDALVPELRRVLTGMALLVRQAHLDGRI